MTNLLLAELLNLSNSSTSTGHFPLARGNFELDPTHSPNAEGSAMTYPSICTVALLVSFHPCFFVHSANARGRVTAVSDKHPALCEIHFDAEVAVERGQVFLLTRPSESDDLLRTTPLVGKVRILRVYETASVAAGLDVHPHVGDLVSVPDADDHADVSVDVLDPDWLLGKRATDGRKAVVVSDLRLDKDGNIKLIGCIPANLSSSDFPEREVIWFGGGTMHGNTLTIEGIDIAYNPRRRVFTTDIKAALAAARIVEKERREARARALVERKAKEDEEAQRRKVQLATAERDRKEAREGLIAGVAVLLYGIGKAAEWSAEHEQSMHDQGYRRVERLGTCRNCGGDGKTDFGLSKCYRCAGSGLHDEVYWERE